MRTRILMALCLVMAFGAVQAVANARQVEPPTSPSARAFTFLPMIADPSKIDLTITRLEISQAIQTPGQSVPLVTNRRTIVRAYLRAISPKAINGVTLSFAATRLGTPVAGSPLIVGPVTAPLAPAQEIYTSTVNVSLPDAWRSGNVTLTVTADPSGAIKETNETNNQRSATLAFNVVPALSLKIVPVAYHDTRTGRYIPAAYTDPVSDFVRRTFPLNAINVTYRVPAYEFWGDLSNQNDWIRLLNSITDLKSFDGAPVSQVYYGLVPSGGFYYPNIRGIGWISLRVAVGVDFDLNVGAHEVGHTFGRLHAPCGSPLDPDPSYPYPNASIGYYGIDVYSNVLVSPAYPNYAKDVMSYCSPQWISDYTYAGLYNDQRTNGLGEARVAPTQVLLIRARFDSLRAAELEPAELLPVYSLEGFPNEAPPNSEYALELIGREGEVISAYPVLRFETSDLDPPAYAIYTAVPQPAQPISKIRLVHAGALLAERPMIDRVPLQAPLQAPQISDNAITLAWVGADVPTLVRYSTVSGEEWTTLGVDILGGRLLIDRAQLPAGQLRFEVIPADATTPIRYTLDVPAGG